jgi:hypothetical protein
MAKDIMSFFGRYADTMDTFKHDSFFFPDKKDKMHSHEYDSEIVKILIISEAED